MRISVFRPTDGSAGNFFLPPYAVTGNQTHVSSVAPPWGTFLIQDALPTELLRLRFLVSIKSERITPVANVFIVKMLCCPFPKWNQLTKARNSKYQLFLFSRRWWFAKFEWKGKKPETIEKKILFFFIFFFFLASNED